MRGIAGVAHGLVVLATALLIAGCSSGDDTGDPSATSVVGNPATSSGQASVDTTVATSTSSTTSTTTTTEPPPTTTTIALDEERRANIPYRPAGNKIIVYGDSMAMSMGEHFLNFTEAGGRLQVVWRAGNGTSLCSWLPSMSGDLAAEQPWAVVVLFSGNTFDPCMADATGAPLTGDAAVAKYESDLAETAALTGAAGVTTHLLTLPITRLEALEDEPTSGKINAVNQAAANTHEHVRIIDAAAAVLNPDGSYTETLPCLPGEPCTGGVDDDGVPVNLVRDPFGGHFCTSGFGPEDDRTYDELGGLCPVWASGAFRYAAAAAAPLIEQAYAEQVAAAGP